FGSMSNLVTAFKAVVTDPAGTDPAAYVEKTFQRSDPDAAVFLTHLGRCFLTEVSLKVVPNYYLQVTNRYPDAKVLFGAPTDPASADSISALLDRFGRIEVIWFPFTTKPWVKTWDLKTEKIEPQVAGPYNYPWANNISIEQSNLIKAGLFIAPWTTPGFGTGQLLVSELNAPDGAVMNGTSRDLLLYVQASTLRVTSYGYAIQIRRQDVQDVAHRVCTQFDAQLKAYQNQGKYPVNGPLELRWTTVDQVQDLGIAGAAPPALAASHSIAPADPSLDTVFWFDALTLPGTPNSDAFYTEFETWMTAQFGTAASNVMRPEWSKAWAYTAADGAWTSQPILTQAIPAHYNQPPGTHTWDDARQTLAEYDKSRLYRDALLDVLLPG
ncbi:MAG TPA: cholesterol oxidase substrate-binding domain-containing protein, partial [Thermoanaerobaculia bacterium]|nr:cholesterol oxidase substrate-binding domain-containing protein [Thermoanaerobaculia bacterium]